jgi:hypothetical protein
MNEGHRKAFQQMMDELNEGYQGCKRIHPDFAKVAERYLVWNWSYVTAARNHTTSI